MEKQSLLFLLLCCLSFWVLVASSSSSQNDENNNNATLLNSDDESYWKMREQEAKKRILRAYNPNPFNVTNHLNHHAQLLEKRWLEDLVEANSTRRELAKRYRKGCMFTNPIDACWRCQPNWERKRKRLAKCALGFGKGTTGGKAGRKYVVTDPSDNDMVNPKPGTLRHAVTRDQPLWIVFAKSMTIRLSQELILTSNKTIDGRGAHVVIKGGAGFTIQFVENVIVHGIKFRDIVPGNGGLIRDGENHFGQRTASDGDAITIFASSHIWIDHCSFSKAYDGIIDIIKGSTAVTISNCHMTNHDKVFLFGAQDTHYEDKNMQVTIAYTHFGKGLVQRMPRCRWGFFHIVNNDYTHWLMYAIGGGMHPTIVSEGNRFIAPPNPRAKEVTHRQIPDSPWDSGTWISRLDMLVNGATFLQSPNPPPIGSFDGKLIPPMKGRFAGRATKFAGPLKCTRLGC